MRPDAHLAVAASLTACETDPLNQDNFCKNSSSGSSLKPDLGLR